MVQFFLLYTNQGYTQNTQTFTKTFKFQHDTHRHDGTGGQTVSSLPSHHHLDHT